MQFKKRYEDIFKASPVGIVIYNSQYQMIEVNPYFIHLTGYSEEELLRLTFLDITHPADVPKNKNLAIRHFQGEVPGYRLEKRYIKKMGI